MALIRTGSETPSADVESGPEPKDSFSVFDTLPNETISEIFLRAVALHILREEEHDERALTIHITHVCRRWRRIALGLGRLWSRVAYCHYWSAPTDVVFQLRLERMSTYIERSQTHDLDVQINIQDRADPASPVSKLGAVWERVSPHLARCVSLKLQISATRVTGAFLFTHNVPVNFSRLKLLRCTFQGGYDRGESSANNFLGEMGGLARGQSFPILEDFAFHAPYVCPESGALYSAALNPASLKRMDVSGYVIPFARPFLTRYTSMTDLTIRSYNHALARYNEPISLPNVLVLRVFNTHLRLLFQSFAAPNLNKLIVADGGANAHPNVRGPEFYDLGFTALRSLFIVNLNGAPKTKPAWANIFIIIDSNPRIDHIRITQWSHTGELLSALASNELFIPDLAILELAGIPSRGVSKLKEDLTKVMQSRPALQIVVDGTSLKPRVVKEMKGAFGERFTDGWAPDLDDARVMTESYLGIDSPLVS